MELDALDRLAAEAFPGSVVRKDLARSSRASTRCRPTSASSCSAATAPAPTRPRSPRASPIVQRQLQDRTVRAGEEELFKSRARERGTVKLIDLVTARLDAGTDCYLATLPSLQLKDVRIGDDLVREQRADAHRRLLRRDRRSSTTPRSPRRRRAGRSGSWACARSSSRKRDVLEVLAQGRAAFTPQQWQDLLLRSVGFEPAAPRPSARRTCCCCGWSRSSSATTTWSSSGRAAPASPTCSSRSRRTPTSSRAARRPSPGCSSTTPPASAASWPVRRRLLR